MTRKRPWRPWRTWSAKTNTSNEEYLVDAEVKGRIAGVAASEGVSVGPVFVHARRELEPERENISEDEVEEELARLQSAVEAVGKKLSQTAERLRESEIGRAHV